MPIDISKLHKIRRSMDFFYVNVEWYVGERAFLKETNISPLLKISTFCLNALFYIPYIRNNTSFPAPYPEFPTKHI